MSARILLALTVLALALAGCGEGSSETSTSSAAAGGAGTDASATSGATGSSGNNAPAASGATAGSGSATAGEQPSPGAKRGPRAKQGPPVPQPTGEPEPGITPEQRREATVASMILQSPSSQASTGGPQALPAEYTCDGKNTSPALRWQGVPQGTAELVLFAMNVQPVGGELFFDWAVAGLSPELEEIEAGKLPKGAVVGRNSFGKTGYGICPEGSGETYVFTLFALPTRLSPGQGFDPLALRKAVTEASGNVGLLALSYMRG